MSNYFHLVLETPQPNLALGMKWLLGTYTQRFNRRHRHWRTSLRRTLQAADSEKRKFVLVLSRIFR
jgi:hypothetical protein